MDSRGNTTERIDANTSTEDAARALHIDWVYPSQAVTRSRLSGAKLVVGRGADCDIFLDHASVSRQHLEIRRQGPIFTFKDLASTNGTYLNGEYLAHSAFAPGDILRVGDCVGVVWQGPWVDSSAVFATLAEGLLGGAALVNALRPVRRAATSRLPVMLLGETGTGKECVARAIHAWSGRTGPFSAINCAALPENLAEAELFGYRRGAFTGSDRASPGLFRAAQQGTLLLDEVGDLPAPIQAKLLRALEQSEVLPLGETTPIPIDVRVISAGQLGLRSAMESGAFREDLFARLSGLTVELPTLRTRREDVIPLFCHFLQQASGGSLPPMKATFVQALCLHDWPRNVRELRLLAEYMHAVHGPDTTLRTSLLPDGFLKLKSAENEPRPLTRYGTRDDQDLHRLALALEESAGNLKAAAATLGISRARAYRLLAGRSADEVIAAARGVAQADRRGGTGERQDSHSSNT